MAGIQVFYPDCNDSMTIEQQFMTTKLGIRKEFAHSGRIVHRHQSTTISKEYFIKQKVEYVRIIAGIHQVSIWRGSKYNNILDESGLVDLILQCQRDNPSNFNPRCEKIDQNNQRVHHHTASNNTNNYDNENRNNNVYNNYRIITVITIHKMQNSTCSI